MTLMLGGSHEHDLLESLHKDVAEVCKEQTALGPPSHSRSGVHVVSQPGLHALIHDLHWSSARVRPHVTLHPAPLPLKEFLSRTPSSQERPCVRSG